MFLSYNGAELHTLGELRIRETGEEMFPSAQDSECPQRKRVTLSVRLDFFNNFDFNANRALVQQVRTALRVQNGVLLWKDETTGAIYLNQTVTQVNSNFPEENAWGTHHQAIELAFTYWDHNITSGADFATFKKTGSSGEPLNLGKVYDYRFRYTASRFNELRAHRKFAEGRITLSGQFIVAATTAARETRRQALFDQCDLVRAEVNGRDGTFKFGKETVTRFEKIVKVEEFDCQPNQKETGIDWTMTASYTEFPNEASYGMAEFDVRTREDNENGTVTLGFSGRVGAQSKTAALTKLDTLRTAFVPATEGGISYAQTHAEISAGQVSADADGDAFIEIRFDEEYKKAISSITNESVKMGDAEDIRAGLLRRTYSGTVTAYSAANWANAYQTAVIRARELGDNKAQMKLSGSITVADNQQTSNRVLTGSTYFATVEFSFEYQLKGTRVYLEFSAETNKETFGTNQQSVSGFVVAATQAIAEGHYATIKAAYQTQGGVRQLLRNERTNVSTQRIARDVNSAYSGDVIAPLGDVLLPQVVTYSPPGIGATYGAGVNKLQENDAAYANHFIKLDFSFQVFLPKVAGGEIAVKYAMDITTEYKERKLLTTVSGSSYARTKEDAEWAIGQVLSSLTLSGPMRSRRTHQKESDFGVKTSVGPAGDDVTAFLQLDFSEDYEATLTGSAAILECDLTEEIEFSGPRIVVQGTPTGRDVIQECGVQSGRRRVNANVKATSESTALAWLRKQYYLPFPGPPVGDVDEPGSRYRLPPRLSFQAGFVSLKDGIFRAGTYGTLRTGLEDTPGATLQPANIAAVQGTISFEEVLPDFSYHPGGA